MTTPSFTPPPRRAIEQMLAPFVARHVRVADPEWQALLVEQGRLRRGRYWKRKLMPFRYTDAAFNVEMKGAYDKLWADYDFERDLAPETNLSPIEWGETGYFANAAVTQRIQQIAMLHVLRQVRPGNVLEVGSGRGLNLLVLAGLLPGTAFTGLELTQSGVDATKAQTRLAELPRGLDAFSIEPPLDRTAYQRVDVVQGSAAQLPFETGAFDLVYSRLALEQMEPIRRQAMAEMARVSRRYVLMVEPFREVNATGLRRHYIVGNNYFQGAIADLGMHGLTPRLVFHDWPAKITLKAALVLAEKTGGGGAA